MFKSQALFALASALAAVSAVNAYTGRGMFYPLTSPQLLELCTLTPSGISATPDSLGTTPCPVQCVPTDFRAALPVDLFPNGEKCCSPVYVSYKGTNIAVTFTDLFLAGEGSFNISLSHQAFAELAPLELGEIYPVVWNL
ncbi:hypothetical protein CVT26_007793 [Gymnopilus dilepis]|uniref:Pherophorin domain-containing protein n=1 Tax=Gymnopilus dilepis TaxID=231916 RepID=A0A409YL85_9AGAR|nr:hypothetical protein CVT26_007793 [Gymnopilus dilepis]